MTMTEFKAGDRVRCVRKMIHAGIPIGTELTVGDDDAVEYDGREYAAKGGIHTFEMVEPAKPAPAARFKAGDRVRCVGTATSRFYAGIPVGTELTVGDSGAVLHEGTYYLAEDGGHTFERVEPEPAPTVPPSPGPALADYLRENYPHETPEVQEVLQDIAREVLRVEIIFTPATVNFHPVVEEDA